MNIKRGLAAIAVAAVSLTSLAACGNDSAQDSEKPESLSFWYYEEDDAGQTQAGNVPPKPLKRRPASRSNLNANPSPRLRRTAASSSIPMRHQI